MTSLIGEWELTRSMHYHILCKQQFQAFTIQCIAAALIVATTDLNYKNDDESIMLQRHNIIIMFQNTQYIFL